MTIRVLLVDDEENLRKTLAAYLEDEGMDVTAVHSGEEAVALVEDGADFDVVIIDMRLPGMDGNEVIRRLHAHSGHTAFLVHTGSAGYVVPQDLRALGINGRYVFEKPLPDMAPLAQAIRQLAGQTET